MAVIGGMLVVVGIELIVARGVTNAVVILIIRDLQKMTSMGIKWLEQYTKELRSNDSLFIQADVNPAIVKALTDSDALEIIGAENVIPATTRLLAAEEMAWEAAQTWLEAHTT